MTDNAASWEVQARDKHGRVFKSWHSSKSEAQSAAKNQRGRYPWGNRVKVVKATGND